MYGAYKAPMAQPRNVLLGQFLGALMGVAVYDFLVQHGGLLRLPLPLQSYL